MTSITSCVQYAAPVKAQQMHIQASSAGKYRAQQLQTAADAACHSHAATQDACWVHTTRPGGATVLKETDLVKLLCTYLHSLGMTSVSVAVSKRSPCFTCTSAAAQQALHTRQKSCDTDLPHLCSCHSLPQLAVQSCCSLHNSLQALPRKPPSPS